MGQLTATDIYRLFERGLVLLQDAAVEGRVGMAILTEAGQPGGYVAAAVCITGRQLASHLLISAAQPERSYRLVPVSLVSRLVHNRVWLNLAQGAVEHLPSHRIQPQETSHGRYPA